MKKAPGLNSSSLQYTYIWGAQTDFMWLWCRKLNVIIMYALQAQIFALCATEIAIHQFLFVAFLHAHKTIIAWTGRSSAELSNPFFVYVTRYSHLSKSARPIFLCPALKSNLSSLLSAPLLTIGMLPGQICQEVKNLKLGKWFCKSVKWFRDPNSCISCTLKQSYLFRWELQSFDRSHWPQSSPLTNTQKIVLQTLNVSCGEVLCENAKNGPIRAHLT